MELSQIVNLVNLRYSASGVNHLVVDIFASSIFVIVKIKMAFEIKKLYPRRVKLIICSIIFLINRGVVSCSIFLYKLTNTFLF
jgi:hypothetical protein